MLESKLIEFLSFLKKEELLKDTALSFEEISNKFLKQSKAQASKITPPQGYIGHATAKKKKSTFSDGI